jgi:hypothetical protein
MAAYLDTSAFDHLYRKVGCTAADIANLRKKIYGRELSILLSIHTLEEILLDQRARPELTVARVKLTLSLGNFRRMVKPCDQLLTDDIRAYAATGEAARPFIDADVQNVLSDGIGELIETDGDDRDEDLLAALEETRRSKEQFRDAMLRPLESVRQQAESVSCITFEEYFSAGAAAFSERVADRQGVLEQCQQRGIEGLLAVRSSRMMTGATLSFAFGWTFEGHSPKPSDSIDLLHAVSAAAVADIFVTDDARLRKLLTRVPLENFQVIGLPAFLSSL